MKAVKVLSVMLICIGCVIAFVGVAAIVLPIIQNDQLRLVLSSFEMPSQNIIVNMMNSAMTFALQNCYLVLGIGAGLAVIGVLVQSCAPKRNATSAVNRRWESAAAPRHTFGTNTVPQWRTSKAAKVEAHNPFATVAATIDGTDPYRPAKAHTFAPAVQDQTAGGDRAEASLYARPGAEEAAQKSPYARPRGSFSEEAIRPAYADKSTVQTVYTPIVPVEPPTATSISVPVEPPAAAPISVSVEPPIAASTEAALSAAVEPAAVEPAAVEPVAATVNSAPVEAAAPTATAEHIEPIAQTAAMVHAAGSASTVSPEGAIAPGVLPPQPPAPVRFTMPSGRKPDVPTTVAAAAAPSQPAPASKEKPTIVMKGFPPPATDAAPLSAPAAPPTPPSVMTAPDAPAKPAKPRIKSTMGKHS